MGVNRRHGLATKDTGGESHRRPNAHNGWRQHVASGRADARWPVRGEKKGWERVSTKLKPGPAPGRTC